MLQVPAHRLTLLFLPEQARKGSPGQVPGFLWSAEMWRSESSGVTVQPLPWARCWCDEVPGIRRRTPIPRVKRVRVQRRLQSCTGSRCCGLGRGFSGRDLSNPSWEPHGFKPAAMAAQARAVLWSMGTVPASRAAYSAALKPRALAADLSLNFKYCCQARRSLGLIANNLFLRGSLFGIFQINDEFNGK